MSSYVESPNNAPIAAAPLAYPYAQYNDDPNTNAFFTAYNQLAAGYLQWFQQNCLGIYTNKSGALLDWIGANLYGLPRPILGSEKNTQAGAVASFPVASMPVAAYRFTAYETATPLTDDQYQRYLTAWLFMGDGKQMSIPWLKARIARFLFGANGSDVGVEYQNQVSITIPYGAPTGVVGSYAVASQAVASIANVNKILGKHRYQINVPSGTLASVLQGLFEIGAFPFPFQVSYQFVIQG